MLQSKNISNAKQALLQIVKCFINGLLVQILKATWHFWNSCILANALQKVLVCDEWLNLIPLTAQPPQFDNLVNYVFFQEL